jgi:hypothetical protein
MAHVKNVVSYSRLVDICTGYGGYYNPGHQNLQLSAMIALLGEAQSSLHMVTQKRNAFNQLINERASAFYGLEKLANQVVGTLIALQVPAATLADARFYSRLVGGRRAKPRPAVTLEDSQAEPPVVRSATQQSYVAKASNFHKLVQMVADLPGYVTNEPELQVPTLMQKAAMLQQLNEAVHRAQVAFKTAMLHRNRILYKGNDSVLARASAIKRYVRVVFGARSGQAAQLVPVSFTKPPKQ